MKEVSNDSLMDRLLSHISPISKDRAVLLHERSVRKLEKVFLDGVEPKEPTDRTRQRWEDAMRVSYKRHDTDSLFTILPNPHKLNPARRRDLERTVKILKAAGIETKSDLLEANPEDIGDSYGSGEMTLQAIEAIYDVAFTEKIMKKKG